MIHIVLVSLTIVLLVVFIVVGAILLRAAFQGEDDMALQARNAARWRPPFIRGGALRDWAAGTTEQLATKRLTRERTAETPKQLMAELGEGAARAMLPLGHPAELERIVTCPEKGQGIVGITAVEALAIAADLRAKRSRAELKRIHDQAAENARALALQRSTDTRQPPGPCPLQDKHHICSAYAARPVQCRPLHATAVAESRIGLDAHFSGSPTSVDERHERRVAEGVELGLERALKSAHLDASRYELNSALATALETPDAAARWARGEPVFEACLSVDGAASAAVPAPSATAESR